MDYWSFAVEDQVALVSPNLAAAPGSLSLAAVAELADLLGAASAPRDEVSVVMLRGADGGFAADLDRDELVRWSAGEEVSGDVLAWDAVTGALRSLPQPTVAAIDGRASGGGCLLALACTFRIGGDQCVFGPVELNAGILGTDSSADLVRLVGPTVAAELLLTARELDAATAKQVGLLSEVLPNKGFDARARRWCQRLATLPSEMVFAIKQAVDGNTNVSRSDLLATQPPNSYLPAAPR